MYSNFCFTTIFFIAVRPTVVINPSFPKIRQGERGSIKCKGSGYPVPEITWFRGSKQITKNIIRNGRNLTADLTFTNVSDANLYVSNKNEILVVVKYNSYTLINFNTVLKKINMFVVRSYDLVFVLRCRMQFNFLRYAD